jgi:hypothetical protein
LSETHIDKVKHILGMKFDAKRQQELNANGLVRLLEQSENALIASLKGEPSGGGASEFAAARYYLKTIFQELENRNTISDSERASMNAIIANLDLANTLITPEHLQTIQAPQGGNSINSDGSINGTNTYENIDVDWAACLLQVH